MSTPETKVLPFPALRYWLVDLLRALEQRLEPELYKTYQGYLALDDHET